MFKVDLASANGARLSSVVVLGTNDFSVVARDAKQPVFSARKFGLISSRLCVRPEQIETRWNGKETHNTANPFDHIVTNLDRSGVPLEDDEGHHNVYVIAADRFAALYERTSLPGVEGPLYRARATVKAVYLPGGFDIVAPWGETQTADRGYLLCNGPDVYGNNAETFEASYEKIDGDGVR